MSFQPGAQLYTQGFGSRPENVEVPHYDVRAPSSTDILYPLGKQWLDTAAQNTYFLVNLSSFGGVTTATWEKVQNASGSVDSLSDGTTKVFPDGTGNIALIGTANEITATSNVGLHRIQFAIPNPFNPPGAVDFTGFVDFLNSSSVAVQSGVVWNFGNLPSFNGGFTLAGGTATFNSGTTISVQPGATCNFGNLPNFNGGVNIAGGRLNLHQTSVASSPYNALGTETFLAVNSSGGAIAINLGTVFVASSVLIISDVGGAAGANNITIHPNGGSSLNVITTGPVNPYVMSANYQSVILINIGGNNWQVLSQGA